MYKSFHIHNFRCFEDLKLDDLARVNLIAGKNNVGKTAFLRRLYIFFNNNYDNWYQVRLRGITNAELHWDRIFKWSDTDADIELSGKNSNGEESVILKAVFDPQAFLANRPMDKEYVVFDTAGNPFPTRTTPRPFPIALIAASQAGTDPQTIAESYTKLEERGQYDLLLDILRIFEPRLNRLTILVKGNKSILSGDLGKKVIPLMLMGEGLNRIANFVMVIMANSHGVVLIDEIENGLHYSILKDVWKAVAYAARAADVQIFATTHSWECVVAAHQAFSESESYDFRYHRLDRSTKTGVISAVTYDQETLEGSIETGVEVR